MSKDQGKLSIDTPTPEYAAPTTGGPKDEDPEPALGRRATLTGTTMTNNEERGGKLPLFDGTTETTDYPTWSALATVEILLAASHTSSLRTLLFALRGTPLELAVGSIDRDTTTSALTLTKGADVLAKLDPHYGATAAHARATARQELSRLRQGGRKFADYLQEVARLGVRAGLTPNDLIPEIMAGVEGRLSSVAASGIGKSYADFTQALLTADKMVPRFKKTDKGATTTTGRGAETKKETRNCYNCEEPGHLARQCKKPKKARKAKAAEEDDDAKSIASYNPNE